MTGLHNIPPTPNNTVGWDLAVTSLRLASQHIGEPRTQAFLQRCLLQIVNILLDQM